MAKKKTAGTEGSASAPPARRAVRRRMDTAADSSTGAASRQPSYDEIAEAAYQRYLRRGGGHGQDFDDWLEAERELRSRS